MTQKKWRSMNYLTKNLNSFKEPQLLVNTERQSPTKYSLKEEEEGKGA
jgi:hypothetical protein